jgi:hypothetical protein
MTFSELRRQPCRVPTWSYIRPEQECIHPKSCVCEKERRRGGEKGRNEENWKGWLRSCARCLTIVGLVRERIVGWYPTIPAKLPVRVEMELQLDTKVLKVAKAETKAAASVMAETRCSPVALW